jgi:hypothetical protein
MRHYEESVLVDAPPEEVWAVLVDVARYPNWDAGTAVDGTLADGGKVTVRAADGSGRAVPVRVALDAPRFMSWTGGLPLGLFRGHRTFVLAPEGAGTRFTMREEFSGPLLGLIWRSMPDLGPSFVQFTHGLKTRTEGQRPTG